MFNTLPHSDPLPCPLPPLSPRRRGGQPSNRNALKHGLHARKNLTPFTPLSNAIMISQPALAINPAIFSHAILELQQQVALLFQASRKANDLRSFLAWHKPLIRGITLIERLKKALLRCWQPQLHLQFVATHALDLIRYDFRSSGITRDANSFRGKIKLSDLNSLPIQQDLFPYSPNSPHSFLTPCQWQVLEPLLPPPDHTLSSLISLSSPNVSSHFGIDRGRGRPPADPHALLDAIFWRFAHHARWQDLPSGSPPMLTCRRYYRRLFLSGRLLTLYSALYQDFLTRAKVDLSALVDQGCFTIVGNALTLRPGHEETWQLRTVLLFMQQGYQVSRRILRERARQPSHLFPHFR